MSRYIYDIISAGEHQQLDFKFEIKDSRKIARTLVAFSNTDGGKLLIGVKDNGKIAGVSSEEEIHMLEGAAELYCSPSINLNFKTWIVEGKTIVEADITEGNQKPYYCLEENGKRLAWFRQDDENHLANIVMLEVWKNKNMDRNILLHFSEKESFLLNYLNVVESITIQDFCRIAGIKRKAAVAILSKLISFGLIRYKYSEGEFYYSVSEFEK